MYLIKHAGKATVKKAQRPEEFMGRSIHMPKGGNKMKGQKELQSMNFRIFGQQGMNFNWTHMMI